jgi:excinuclease ABC subunit B
MTHNKTLAAQLYSEFKSFFPQNHVEYFISYYDYYQPEAYIPRQDLFIEKDSSINSELERLRLSSTASLLEYDDVIIVSSVSANYGLGDPSEYKKMVLKLSLNQEMSQRDLLYRLVDMGYTRNDSYFDRANFRVNGESVDIFLAYKDDEAIRVEFFGDEVDSIYSFDVLTHEKREQFKELTVYSANQFIVESEKLKGAMREIEAELQTRLSEFKEDDKLVELQRLQQRVEFDLEMLETTGSCKGVENYSRHLSGKKAGETPYTLMDYFEEKGKPYLVIVDESHVSLPQFRGMYAGDRSRKEVLVDYGFRLPSALDNRPLKFDEFIHKAPYYLFVSATPAELELQISTTVANQIIRPTGLLEAKVTLLPSQYQVEALHDEIKKVVAKGDRVLVTTLTKKMSEELSTYYKDLGIKSKYLHSDIDAIERNQIIRALRQGTYDVLIGVNLLREGLDLPEVSLIAILDADKEGFLRSETSLIQTMGRACRNLNGQVLMFADKITSRTDIDTIERLENNKEFITKSMYNAILTTLKRRAIQDAYNKEHNITPKSVERKLDENLKSSDMAVLYEKKSKSEKIPKSQKKDILKELTKQMHSAAKELNFEEAIRLRDEIEKIKAM